MIQSGGQNAWDCGRPIRFRSGDQRVTSWSASAMEPDLILLNSSRPPRSTKGNWKYMLLSLVSTVGQRITRYISPLFVMLAR
jgi:hypothetical protein